MDLKDKIKSLPLSPGVYLMKNSYGDIIYVGKSKSLKNRVSSYFQNSRNHPPKIERLIKTLKDFDYILTDTEFEAFMLECELIKKFQPIYNKQMKSTASYIYIEIDTDKANLSVKTVNVPNEKHSNVHFGPYTSKNTVEKAIQGIKEFYKIDCSSSSKRNTPCLNYSLGLCIGMCLGGKALEKHAEITNRIINLFNGEDMNIIEEMEQKMIFSSKNYDFETAAKYRDYISAIKSLINKEKVIEFAEANRNILVVENLDDSKIKLFLIKGNKILFKEKYDLSDINEMQLLSNIKKNIMNYFKNNESGIIKKISKEDIDEAQIIYSYLKSNNCNYVIIPNEWLDTNDEANIESMISGLINLDSK